MKQSWWLVQHYNSAPQFYWLIIDIKFSVWYTMMHDLDNLITVTEQGSVKRSEHFLSVWNSLSQIYIHPTIKHGLAPSAADDIKLLPRQSENKQTNRFLFLFFICLLFGYFWTTYWQNETENIRNLGVFCLREMFKDSSDHRSHTPKWLRTRTFRFTAKAPKHCFAEMSKSDEISEGEIKWRSVKWSERMLPSASRQRKSPYLFH